MHLTIAMLTYRRNEYLAQVIPQLLEQADDVSGPDAKPRQKRAALGGVTPAMSAARCIGTRLRPGARAPTSWWYDMNRRTGP